MALQFPTLSSSSLSPQSKTRLFFTNHSEQTLILTTPKQTQTFLRNQRVSVISAIEKRDQQTLTLKFPKQTRTSLRNRNQHISAIEERRQETESESDSAAPDGEDPSPENRPAVEVSEIGQQIKKAMEERKKKEEEGGGGDFWGGVAAEVREIEWPAFGKVIGTTGVVLGVIAGSSVVLLTVNAVLAELSDRVFAGRGVQDFFG